MFLNKMRHQASKSLILLLLFVFTFTLAGCGDAQNDAASKKEQPGEPLVLADCSWDSVKAHNRIVGYILEHGYGYPRSQYVFVESLPMLQGLSKGDLDICMEVWTDNLKEPWEEELNKGTIKDLGPNFTDAPQGWYVPTYMIEGDTDRGIKAIAPGLKSVEDLPKYWELFRDPEVPTKGRFHNSIPGWLATEINETKIKTYQLDKYYNIFSTGSDTALAASMVTAYEKGEPWLGYYWEPTWVMGKLDMTRLEEPPFDEAVWNDPENRGCAFPKANVVIGINAKLESKAPEVVEFLKKYETTLDQNNDFLAYMQENDGNADKAAIYFLKKYPATWKAWLPADVAKKVETALEKQE